MKHEYYLAAKTCGIEFSKYKGTSVRISECVPKTVDMVWIKDKNFPKILKSITTFRDENGDIIERSFDYSDGKLRNRLYTHQTTEISEEETVDSTIVRNYFINKRVLPFYNALLKDYQDVFPLKNILWNLTHILTNHLSTNNASGEKVLSQVKITNIQTPTKQCHTFIEYPHIISGKIEATKKKFMSFLVNGLTNKLVEGSVKKEGVRFPKNDKWLPFRAITIDDSKEPFTSEFLREKKLKRAKIEINPEYYPKNEDEKLYAADFDPDNGSINFNRFFEPYSKTRVIGIARHETEHAWQYFLNARFSEPTTEWEEFISQTFGKIKSKALNKEAEVYAKSIKKYVTLTKDLEKNGKIQKYRENYIEKMARKTAERLRREYDKQGKNIRSSFPYIPEEYL